MKYIFFSFFLTLATAKLTAQAPVAYYPCNGNANDSSGNNLHGTIMGTVAFTADRFGHPNAACLFDANAANRIEISDNALLRPASITISAWVRVDGIYNITAFVNKALDNCINDSWHVGSQNSNYSVWLANSSGCGDVVQQTTPLTVGVWQFVTMTVNDATGTRELYVDGELVATAPFSASLQYDNHPVVLGAAYENGAVDFPLKGALDDVKIYNTALSAAQIRQEFAGSLSFNKTGSGNAIKFDPSLSNKINIGGNFNLQEFTIQMWVNPAPTQTAFADIIDNNHTSNNWVCEFINVGTTYCWGAGGVCVNFTLQPDTWQQLTLEKTATESKVYINGILVGSTSAGAINYANTPNIVLGAWAAGGREWSGQMDEVRFWNVALSETQIQERMCRKIESTDALYANLIGYYNFDESVGLTILDATAAAQHGTMVNNPARLVSEAPIGNASAYDYVNATKTATIGSSTGESFTVTSGSGNPDGIHLYRVDEMPNTLDGVIGLGTSDKYFGVFQVNGSSPAYVATYNYSGNPDVNAGNENTLALYKRTNNASTTWRNATASLDMVNNTLTCTGQSTEYILGSAGTSLPLDLLSFTGSLRNGIALLNWVTSNEINVSHFEIERSQDGRKFKNIGRAATNPQHIYSFDDAQPETTASFYRLKMVDADEKFTYSNVIKLNTTKGNAFRVFPNPASNIISIRDVQENGTIKIVSMDGKLVKEQTVTPGMSIYIGHIEKGVYIIQYINRTGVQSERLIIQ